MKNLGLDFDSDALKSLGMRICTNAINSDKQHSFQLPNVRSPDPKYYYVNMTKHWNSQKYKYSTGTGSWRLNVPLKLALSCLLFRDNSACYKKPVY